MRTSVRVLAMGLGASPAVAGCPRLDALARSAGHPRPQHLRERLGSC